MPELQNPREENETQNEGGGGFTYQICRPPVWAEVTLRIKKGFRRAAQEKRICTPTLLHGEVQTPTGNKEKADLFKAYFDSAFTKKREKKCQWELG